MASSHGSRWAFFFRNYLRVRVETDQIIDKKSIYRLNHIIRLAFCGILILFPIFAVLVYLENYGAGGALWWKVHHRNYTTMTLPLPPQFIGWGDLLSQLNCSRVMANDTAYISGLARNRIRFSDPEVLDMDCRRGIRHRNYFPEKGQMREDADFPLAQGRIVYKDYVLVEKELASAYSPHNWYCYVVDEKAEKLFKWRMNRLAQCVPNVIIGQQFSLDSAGHNYTRAYLDCMARLTVPDKKWEYIAFLQNHAIAIKTNREAVQIYRWLDGANDVQMFPKLDSGYNRVDLTLDWSFKAIHLFRNETRNFMDSPHGYPAKLLFSKGWSEYSLSRKMAEFVLNELDLRIALKRQDQIGYGGDEILISTLNDADAIQAPGGFTRECWAKRHVEEENDVWYITRHALWFSLERCGSSYLRHYVCVFGLEDLARNLAKLPHLFVNKLMPDFDFGALLCWWQEMHRRAYFESREQSLARLDKQFYTNLPHVRFQKLLANLSSSNQRGEAYTARHKEAVKQFDCKMP